MEWFSENNDNGCWCPLFQVDLAHLLAAREQELRTLSAEVYMIKFCPFNFFSKQKRTQLKFTLSPYGLREHLLHTKYFVELSVWDI